MNPQELLALLLDNPRTGLYSCLRDVLDSTEVPKKLRPATYGYLHGRNAEVRGLPREERDQRADRWTTAVASFLTPVVSCIVCGHSFAPNLRPLVKTKRIPSWCSKSCQQADPKNLIKQRETFLKSQGMTRSDFLREVKNRLSPEQKTRRSMSRQATLESNFGSMKSFHLHVTSSRVATWQSKYGVSNPSKNKSIFNRQNAYRVRPLWVKGKKFKVQGYEDRVVRDLILKRGVPTSRFIDFRKVRLADNKTVYFPDFVLTTSDPSVNTVIEVKSQWTAGATEGNGSDLFRKKLLAKARLTVKLGHRFILACVDESHPTPAYLEWPFTVAEVRRAFKEIRSLST